MSLWAKLKERMLEHPCSMVCEEDQHYTYEVIIQEVERFSRLLREDCYAIYCHSELHAAMAVLACFAAQKTAVPLSYRYGEIHCTRILNCIKPPCIITDISDNGELSHKIWIKHNSDAAYVAPPEHPALIMFTSGTTGSPKGVMLTEKNLYCNLQDILTYFQITQDDRILIPRPLYHCAVLTGEFLISLIVGCGIVFYSKKFNPLALLKLIQEEKITVMGNTPTLWKNLCFLAHTTKNPIFLNSLVISGEVLPSSTAAVILRTFPQANIYHVYGLTEASPRVAFMPPLEFATHADSVGYPLPSISYRIVNDNGQNVPLNETGELLVKGDNIMCGYYENPTETDRKLQDGWLLTGDMASVDENGFIKIHGRKDDLMIRAGMNIYPGEIEAVLREDERVQDLYVYGIPDAVYGEAIVLVVSGRFASEREVRALCNQKLPSYEIPTHIKLRPQLTYTASGKLIRTKE